MRRHRLMRPEVSTVPCEGNDLLHLARNQPAETLDAGAGNSLRATAGPHILTAMTRVMRLSAIFQAKTWMARR